MMANDGWYGWFIYYTNNQRYETMVNDDLGIPQEMKKPPLARTHMLYQCFAPG